MNYLLTCKTPLPFLRRLLALAFLMTVVSLINPSHSFAQKEVNILHADRLEGGKVGNQNVRRLIGNVQLKSKDIDLECDSAYQFLNSDELRAFGNIEVKGKKGVIWADTAIYHTKSKYSTFIGHVIFLQDSVTIFTSLVHYNYSTEIAHILSRLRMEDKKGTLLADRGTYYQKIDSAAFHGNVQLADSTQYIEADSLFSNRRKKYYVLYGRVFVRDKKNSLTFVGDYAHSDSSGHRFVQGNARLDKYKPDKPDTNYIQGDLIAYHQVDSSYTFHSVGNVRIWNKQFSSRSDSAAFVDSTGHFILTDSAKAWYKHMQLTAPTILITIRQDTVRRLNAFPNAFSVQQDSLTKRLDQISGDTLTGWFKKGAMDHMLIRPNAHMLYFTHNGQNQPDGAINMSSDSLRILLTNGQVDTVKALKGISGTYLEESKETEKMKLKGFSWNPKERPNKPQKPLRQRLPAIPDHEPFPLPERYLTYISTKKK